MARTSSPMLNKSGKNKHPCPVSNLRGNAFSFSLKKTLAVGLSDTAVVIEEGSCCVHLVESCLFVVAS